MLAHQGALGPFGQVRGHFQAAAEQQLTAPLAAADRDAEVDQALGIGEEDVTQAAAGTPKPFGHGGQFPVVALGHQGRDVGRQQQAQVAGVAGVAHAHIRLDAVERKEGEPRHHQAHHQGGHGQQLGLQAEFGPPAP